MLAAVAFFLYVPYFLTAQSQASGIVPNLFNPTRVGQFVAMFGTALLAIAALLVLAWHAVRPTWKQVAGTLALAYGLPLLFLLLSIFVVTNTEGAKKCWRACRCRTTRPGTWRSSDSGGPANCGRLCS